MRDMLLFASSTRLDFRRPPMLLHRSSGDTMFCNNCGAPVPSGGRFCGQCGFPVGGSPDGPAAAGAVPGSSPGYTLDPREFEHPSMQKMNQFFRGSVVLRKSAESLSRKVGKPWYESSFNSILATDKNYPRVLEA